MKKQLLFGAAFFLLSTAQIFAQDTNQKTNNNPTPSNQTSGSQPADEKNSDLVITANVRAKELKFEVVPTPTVTFPGNQPRQTVWEADRTNLPSSIEPGVVYRDIGIRLRIYSRFSEIQRIVIEALDETGPSSATPGAATQTSNAAGAATPTPNIANQTNQPAAAKAKP